MQFCVLHKYIVVFLNAEIDLGLMWTLLHMTADCSIIYLLYFFCMYLTMFLVLVLQCSDG